MPGMSTPIQTSKLLLVADRRDAVEPGCPAIRRYRLARLVLKSAPAGDAPAVRLEHA